MESWDILDENRHLTGKKIKRGTDCLENEYRLVIHICIFNSKNKMLIQQRQPFKEGWSNMWDVTVGGGALAGESSKEAAHRELLEEIGLDIDFTNERPFFTVNFNNGFDDFYLL
jgi:isopentenyldiphosphate isomerase